MSSIKWITKAKHSIQRRAKCLFYNCYNFTVVAITYSFYAYTFLLEKRCNFWFEE